MLTANSPASSPSPMQEGEIPPASLLQGMGGRPLRVLYVATSRNDGGVERYSVRMAAELYRRGYFLSFACLPGEIVERRAREADLPTLPFQLTNSGDLRAAFRLADLLVAERIDLLHVHSRRDYVPALVGTLLARRRQRGRAPRLVLHAHMLRALGEPPKLSGRLFARVADAVIAVSGVVREHLIRHHQLPPTFVRLLHNGVSTDKHPQPGGTEAAAVRAAFRQEFSIPKDALVIGMVGRLDAKGQAKLLEAAPALIAQFPTLYFVFVGAEGEAGERVRLHAMAERGGFGGQMVFTGPREDIPAVMAAFDVLAHLPTDEAFGLAIIEAMAAGLPVVAMDIGGCREVVRDNETGTLVPSDQGHGTALTEALSRLLAQPDLRRLWGNQGRQTAEREYSFTRQIDHLQALYQELCPVSASETK